MALSTEYAKDILEWIQWYNYHRATLSHSGVEQQLAFQEKAIYGLFKLVAGLSDEAARIDAGERVPQARPSLYVPIGGRFE